MIVAETWLGILKEIFEGDCYPQEIYENEGLHVFQ